MSHDKYSSSHQISVGKDLDLITSSDKKLKIKAAGDVDISTDSDIIISSTDFSVTSGGNLNIAGDLSVTDITATDITASGNISGNISGSNISGNINAGAISATSITASGAATASSFEFQSTKEKTIMIPLSVAFSDISATKINMGAVALTNLDSAKSTADFILGATANSFQTIKLFGDLSNTDWQAFIDITPYLTNGSRIESVSILAEFDDLTSVVDPEVTVSVNRATLGFAIGIPGLTPFTQDASATVTFPVGGASVDTLYWYKWQLNSSHDINIDNGSAFAGNWDIYKLRIRQTAGDPILLNIYGIAINISVNNVEQSAGVT